MSLTKKEQKRAARDRERMWSDLTAALHNILDRVLREQRAPLEAAHLNGYGITVGLKVHHPDDLTADPAPAPAPLVVTP